MKVTIVGVERMEGVSQKSGKPYAIGRIYGICKLEERSGEKQLVKGGMGTTYEVEVDVVKKIEKIPLPFEAVIDAEDVMRFGKRETKVLDVRPAEHVNQATGEITPIMPSRKAA